jgi:hypothetical protein
MTYWRELGEDVRRHLSNKFRGKPKAKKKQRVKVTVRVHPKQSKGSPFKALKGLAIKTPVAARVSNAELARRIREKLKRRPGAGYYAEEPPRQRYL